MVYNNVTGTFNVPANVLFDIINLQDLYFYCDTTSAPVIINLPLISPQGQASAITASANWKVYITDINGNAGTNSITVNVVAPNKINAASSVSIGSNGGAGYIIIAGSNDWMFFGSGAGSSPSISIPTPIIKLGKTDNTNHHPDLYAEYIPLPNGSAFKAFAPSYYLFMAKSRKRHIKKILHVKTNVNRAAGFYHPTHRNGINFPPNTKVYGGTTVIPFDTEYPMRVLDPYVRTVILFNPYQFTRYRTGGAWAVMTPTVLAAGVLTSNLKVMGGKTAVDNGTGTNRKNKRSALFCLAIGIRNPDVSDTAHPILFGDFSLPFRLTFVIEKGAAPPQHKAMAFMYTIQNSGVKRNIIPT